MEDTQILSAFWNREEEAITHVKHTYGGYSYPEQETRTYGDVEALLFHGDINYPLTKDGDPNRGAPTSGNIYSQILFWSDGYYLYCLKLPLTYNLPVTDVEKIVTSLTVVEDLSQYLTAE